MGDAASEKIESLKSLNAMLLKETVERRQQVDSLVQSNEHLESELNRSVMDKASLQTQLNALTERAVMLEIEKGLVSVFVAMQANQLAEVSGKERDGFCRERVVMEERIESLEGDMKRVLEEKSEIEKARSEKESEIGDLNSRLDELIAEIDEERVVSSRVCDERDFVRAQLDARVQEVNGLRLKMTEAEKREACILDETMELKFKYDRLVEENADSEKRIEAIISEKDLVEMNVVELNRLVDELKRNTEELLGQKKMIEDEKTVEERKNDVLQTSVGELKDLVQSMRIEEEALLEKVADLENRNVVSSKNEEDMRMEIDGLVEEKKETEGRIQSLVNGKSLVTKELEDVMKVMEHQKLTIKQIVQDKTEMETAKIQAESEIVKMKEQLSEFKGMISSLENSRMDQIEKLQQLEVEASHYKAAFDQATMEKNETRESFDMEKTIRTELVQKITRMEKEIEDLHEELAKMTTENGIHLGEKKDLENRCAALVEEVALLETRLAGTQKEFDDTKSKLGLAEANLNRVLNILKDLENRCAALVKEVALLETRLAGTQKEFDDTNSKLGLAEANLNRVLNILKNTLSICYEDTDFDQENGVQEGIKDHVTELKAIKRAFKDKESRVEDMKRQLELLKRSAEARKGKSFWTMVSSATILAAASVVYVTRAH